MTRILVIGVLILGLSALAGGSNAMAGAYWETLSVVKYRPVHVATAVNLGGHAFYGKGRTYRKAARRALKKCRRNSFHPRACRVVSAHRVIDRGRYVYP